MTTAARPTWDTARGGHKEREYGPTAQFSSRDLPGHKILKTRRWGEIEEEEEDDRKDFKSELLEREKAAQNQKRQKFFSAIQQVKEKEENRAIEKNDDAKLFRLDQDDPLTDGEGGGEGGAEGGEGGAEAESTSSSSGDESDDDTAELLAELQKIKRERAEELAKKQETLKSEQEKIKNDAILTGNPLVNSTPNFTVSRRWDDDVVFKNCAKGKLERPENRFINDTIRSDFHRKFMAKYIQ
eukprot:Sdes_comp19842_c0_seq1m12058